MSRLFIYNFINMDMNFDAELENFHRLTCFFSDRFGLSGDDLYYILRAALIIPVPSGRDIGGVLQDIFGDFNHIYHVSTIPLEDNDDIIPDAFVRYDYVRKIAAVICTGSKKERDKADRVIKRCIKEGRLKEGCVRSGIEYTSIDAPGYGTENLGAEIFFLGYEKLQNGPELSNQTRLKCHFEEHPEDLELFK